MMAMNLRPSSDALSFSKLCMRSFGNLIPRQGHQETGDQFVSAIKAAWKFQELAKQAEIIKELRLKGEATVPFSLGDNLKSNPFLRADTKELQAIMGLDNPAEVFGAVRKKKDSF